MRLIGDIFRRGYEMHRFRREGRDPACRIRMQMQVEWLGQGRPCEQQASGGGKRSIYLVMALD